MFKHVLLIDPSPADTKQIRSFIMSRLKCKVTLAGRTSIGIEELATKHKVPIDMIILDIAQPDGDDLDAIRKVRWSSPAYMPIVVLSSENEIHTNNPGLMFRALESGAYQFITKKDFYDRFDSIMWLTDYKRQAKIAKDQA